MENNVIEQLSKTYPLDPMRYKEKIIKYLKYIKCPLRFSDNKDLSNTDAITAVENETPIGIIIANEIIDRALDNLFQRHF